MCQDVAVASYENPLVDAKRSAINVAAIDQFSARGFAGTSMANIADAAGMSRPALYQHFKNKGDIFASAFVALFDDCVDKALAGLNGSGTTTEQLDRFLQSFYGDLWERTAASPHSDEILNAKHDHASTEIALTVERLWHGASAYLLKHSPGRGAASVARRSAWLDLLRLSPTGFKSDQPTVEVYRNRLSALARTVAADVNAS